MGNFKRANPRQAKVYFVPDIGSALNILRECFKDVHFEKGTGDRLIVSLTGSFFHDSIVEKKILDEIGGIPA